MQILIIIGAILLVGLSLNTGFAASPNDDKIIINSTITTDNDNINIGEVVNVTGVVTDENGNPVGNTLVNVMVDGKTYTVMTNGQGRWVVSYQTIRTGLINTSVSSDRNDSYVGFINCGFFEVYSPNTGKIPA